MARTRTWTIEINIVEHEDGRRTRADAVLRSARPALGGGDEVRRWPDDPEVPVIGDEPVTARALADLACKLLDDAGDLDRPTYRPMRILS
jgi:hypothetical protein